MKKTITLLTLAASLALVTGCNKEKVVQEKPDQTTEEVKKETLTYKVDGKKVTVDADKHEGKIGLSVKVPKDSFELTDYQSTERADDKFVEGKGKGNLSSATFSIQYKPSYANVENQKITTLSTLGDGTTSIEEVNIDEFKGKFDYYLLAKYPDGKEVHYFSKTENGKTKELHFKVDSSQVNNETLAEIKAIAGSIK